MSQLSTGRCITGYPLKLHFQIPCVFPVRRHIFPVPIYVIWDYYIHKTDLADLSLSSFNFWGRFSWQISKYLTPLESGNLQLEQTKFPVFYLCFGQISKFPVFSLTGILFAIFPVQWVPWYKGPDVLEERPGERITIWSNGGLSQNLTRCYLTMLCTL